MSVILMENVLKGYRSVKYYAQILDGKSKVRLQFIWAPMNCQNASPRCFECFIKVCLTLPLTGGKTAAHMRLILKHRGPFGLY